MSAKTGDIRIDEIAPRLNEDWPTVDFEESLERVPVPAKKFKSKELYETGCLPVIDQGESFVAGYTNEIEHAYSGPLPVIVFGDHTRRFKYIDRQFGVGAEGIRILRPKAMLDPRFFYHYMCSLNLVSAGYSRHYKFLRTVPVPVPSLDEQRRIVAKLEALLARVNAARERLDKIPTLLKHFRQAVLATACAGRFTQDSCGSHGSAVRKEVALGEIAAEMRTGPFGSALHKSDYAPGGVPVINPMNLVQGKIVPSAQVAVPKATFNRLQEYALRADDIIIARRGEMGRCALVTARESGWLCGTGSAILRLKPEARPAYVALVISSPAARAYLSESSVGTTMENLNQQVFKDMPVFLPPVQEQDEIVRRVRDLHNFADRLETRCKKSKEQVDQLTQSVLAKAFRGEIVLIEAERAPLEGRSYETAEVFLAPIQVPHGHGTSAPRGPRKKRECA